MVLPGTDTDDAQRIATRLLEAVRNITIRQASEWQVTISIGVATTDTIDRLVPTDLMRAADNALHRAKAAGKDRSAT